MEMGLKRGLLIQMDVGVHPPIPLAQNNCPLWQFHSIFSTVFRVPNFQGRFEALNDGFWQFRGIYFFPSHAHHFLEIDTTILVVSLRSILSTLFNRICIYCISVIFAICLCL